MKFKLLERIKLTETIDHFKFSRPDGFEFKAGQFVLLHTPFEDKIVKRAYSIASSPSDDFIELCIKHVPNGKATTYLFGIEIGEEIEFSGPMGHMILKEDGNDFVFIAVSTGIAPFRSMIKHLLETGKKEKIMLILGSRYEQDVLYHDEFEEMHQKHPNFNYFTIISRCQQPKCKEGYVQDVVKKEIINEEEHDNKHYYLCGFPVMVKENKEILMEKGVDVSKIKFEAY